MSEEKKKKVIHVDKLIVKANEVIIEPQHQPRPPRRDPWFGFGAGPQEVSEAEDTQESPEESGDEASQDDNNRPPFSWI